METEHQFHALGPPYKVFDSSFGHAKLLWLWLDSPGFLWVQRPHQPGENTWFAVRKECCQCCSMLAAIVISHWQLEFVSAEWVAKEHLDQCFSNFFVPLSRFHSWYRFHPQAWKSKGSIFHTFYLKKSIHTVVSNSVWWMSSIVFTKLWNIGRHFSEVQS